MTRTLIDDCFIHDRDRLRHDDAIAILKSRLAPVVGTECIPIEAAHGRFAPPSMLSQGAG